jgi:hypothetical protein
MSLNIELEGSGLIYSIILARLCNLSGTPINESQDLAETQTGYSVNKYEYQPRLCDIRCDVSVTEPTEDSTKPEAAHIIAAK